MQALIKNNVVYCKVCEQHNYKGLDYKTVTKEGESHTQIIARCNGCGTEFYFFTKLRMSDDLHYVFDEEAAEVEENLEVIEEMVTITKKEYESLLDSASKLTALENNGVDNWVGYGDAMTEYEEEKEGNE